MTIQSSINAPTHMIDECLLAEANCRPTEGHRGLGVNKNKNKNLRDPSLTPITHAKSSNQPPLSLSTPNDPSVGPVSSLEALQAHPSETLSVSMPTQSIKLPSPISSHLPEPTEPVTSLIGSQETKLTSPHVGSKKGNDSHHSLGAVNFSACRIGQAGECLVMADLLKMGFDVYQSSPALPYDLLVDMDGRLIRVQVKTSRFIKRIKGRKGDFYEFRVQTSSRAKYKQTDFDLIACVGLVTNDIAYFTHKVDRQNIRLTLPGTQLAKTGSPKQFGNIDQHPFHQALEKLAA